jgi:hypothetical protein
MLGLRDLYSDIFIIAQALGARSARSKQLGTYNTITPFAELDHES